MKTTETKNPNVRSPGPGAMLRAAFVKRQALRPGYSLRALARAIQVSPAYLSLVFNEKVPPSLELTMKLIPQLQLEEAESAALLRLLLAQSQGSRHLASALVRSGMVLDNSEGDSFTQYAQLEADQYRSFSEWYHTGILELSYTRGFKSNVQWIAKRLGISVLQARDACERLVRMGLLTEKDGTWMKAQRVLFTHTQSSLAPVREYHKRQMDKVKDELEKTDDFSFAHRSITGTTISTTPAKIAEAKVRIQKFREQLTEFLTDGSPTEVFQLNVQLYPLTKLENKEGKRTK